MQLPYELANGSQNDEKGSYAKHMNNKIVVERDDASTENGLLARCVVGHF